MIKQYTYNLVLKHSAGSVTKKGSKYAGGFIMKNGRKNNSKEYNHDYYLKNKEKWNKELGSPDYSTSSGGRHFRPRLDELNPNSAQAYDQLQDFYKETGDWSDEKRQFIYSDRRYQKAEDDLNRSVDRLRNEGETRGALAEAGRATARYVNIGYDLSKEYDDRKKRSVSKSNTSSSGTKPYVSKEYQQELEYNSRKNKYR